MEAHGSRLRLQPRARVAGLLYLVIIVLGIFDEIFVRGRMIVSGDAAATAQNILTHALLYRLGFAAGLVILVCAIIVALLLFDFFRVVDESLARLAVFFNLVSIPLEAAALLGHFAPLILLGGGRYTAAVPAEQLWSLSYISLRMQTVGYDVSLAFFGCFCVVTGVLIFRSTFLPRIIGVLMVIAGLCYLINSFASFVAPPFRASLLPFILLPCLIGEGALCLWLLVRGVNVERWKALASPGHAGSSKASTP